MSGRAQSDLALVGGQYEVDVTKPLPGAGGGIPAFTATSTRAGTVPLMALRVDRYAPVRSRALQLLSGTMIDGMSLPLGQGLGPPVDGEPAWFLICQAPPGPAL